MKPDPAANPPPEQKKPAITAMTVIGVWARGDKCFSPQHQAIARFIVDNGLRMVPSCGDHLSVAVREAATSADPPAIHVRVWLKP